MLLLALPGGENRSWLRRRQEVFAVFLSFLLLFFSSHTSCITRISSICTDFCCVLHFRPYTRFDGIERLDEIELDERNLSFGVDDAFQIFQKSLPVLSRSESSLGWKLNDSLQQQPFSLLETIRQCHLPGCPRQSIPAKSRHRLLDLGEPILQHHGTTCVWCEVSDGANPESRQLHHRASHVPYELRFNGCRDTDLMVDRDQELDG